MRRRPATANDILYGAGWPSVGTEVTVQGRMTQPFEGRVIDAANVEGEAVATVQDIRTGVVHYLDQGLGITMTPLPSPEQRQEQAENEEHRAELERIRGEATEAGFETVFNQAQFDELDARGAVDFEEVETGQRKQVLSAIEKRVTTARQNVEKARQGEVKRQRDEQALQAKADQAAQKATERVQKEAEKETTDREKAERDRQKEEDARLVYRQQAEEAYTDSEDLGADWQGEAETRVRKEMGIEPDYDIDTDRERRGTYLTLYKGEVKARRKEIQREEKEAREAEVARARAEREQEQAEAKRRKAEEARRKEQEAARPDGDGRPVERAEGEREVPAGRQSPAPRPGRPAGKPKDVLTPAGRRVPVQPELVEAADLIASHDEGGTVNPNFPTALQPRDRSRAASQAQILQMAANLQPELLMPTAQAAEGAPVIGPDMVVESGNARTIAMALAYRQHPESAKRYREHLEAQGFDTEGMTAPVLVQRRTGEMTEADREAFAREANVRTTAERGAAEQAASDAKEVTPAVLSAYQGGDVNLAANRDFVRAFIAAVVPEAERGAMLQASGEVSQAGLARIENAMFARAYGADELLAALREATDTNLKSIGKAMIEMAPAWSQMREAAAKGQIDPDMDQTANLVAAARIVHRARVENRAVAEFVNQTDFLQSDLDPMVETFMAWFFEDTVKWTKPTGQPRIVTAMQVYVDDAMKTSTAEDIFGEKVTPAQIAKAGREKQYAERRAKERQQELVRAAKRGGQRAEGAGRRGREPGAQATEAGARREDRGAGERAAARAAPRVAPKGLASTADARSGNAYWNETEYAKGYVEGAQDPHLAAREWVLAAQQADGFEHMVLIDIETGAVEAGSTHQTNAVNLPTDTLQALYTAERNVALHHNHPSGRPLSVPDMGMLAGAPGVRSVVAHGSDGAAYSASLTPDSERAQDQMGLKSFLSRFLLVSDDVTDVIKRTLQPLIDAGTLTITEAEMVHGDIRNRALHAAGIINYQTTLPALDVGWYKDAAAAAEKAANDGKRKYLPDSPISGADRPARVVRSPGELGAAPRRLEEDQGRRVARSQPEARRRTSDRAQEGRGPPEGLREDRLEFSDPETQAAWERGSKGFAGTRPPLVTRIGEYISYFGSLWVRAYKHLPRTPEFADAHAYLRQIAAAPSVATEEIVRYLHGLTADLSQDDLQLFTKKIVMDDLQHDVANEMEIPIFRDYADFRAEYAKIEAAMQKRPDLMKRVHKRRRYVNKVKRQMIEAGLLKETDAANPAYFHHAVLAYAPASKAFGGTKKLQKPTLYRRRGTQLDINTKLVEAESEWLFRALTGIQTMQAIDKIKARYDKAQDIKDDVRERNKAAVDELVKSETAAAIQAVGAPEGTPVSELSPTQIAMLRDQRPVHTRLAEFRRNIAIGMRTLRSDESITSDMLPKHLRVDFEAMVEEDQQDGSGEIAFPVVAWIAQNLDNPGAAGAAAVLKNVSARRQFLKDLLGDKYMNPGNLDSALKAFGQNEEWSTWQPDKGRVMFMAKTIPEHVMDRYIAHLAKNLGEQQGHFTNEEMQALLESVTDQMVLGGLKPQMVLPKELVDTIEDMGGIPEEGPISTLFARVVRLHKQWLLISPRTWFRYNLQNISGDFDGALAAFPAAIRPKKYMGPVISELWDVQIKRGKPSQTYLDAAERGVFDAGWSLNEVYEAEANIGDVMGDPRVAQKNLRRVWRFFSRSTTFRENWLRYAMYKAVLDKIEAAEAAHPGQPPSMIMPMVGYGAAKAEIVDATADPKDRAALIARESIGDYGEISVAGDYLRHRWLWFWSWQEINFKRYFRLGQNIWLTQRGFGRARALAGLNARVGTRTAMWLAFRAGLFFGAVQIWNHMLFPEEEEELSEEDRWRLHVILGRDPDGKVIAVRMPGALSDFMGVFGYTDVAQGIAEMQRGRGTWDEILTNIALAPVNRVVGGVTPILKVPVEALTGQTTFPKFWEPRGVKDPWRHIFRTFKLEHEYDAVLGRPTRGYFHSWAEAGVSRRDPGENAYHYIRGLGYDWNKTVKGVDFRGAGFDERSRALYHYRKAYQLGDEAAVKRYRGVLRELGVKGQNMRQALARMHPLGMLAKKDRRRFLKSLTAEERRRLKRAVGWYNTTFRGGR